MRANLKEINSAGNVNARSLIKSNGYEKKIDECKSFRQSLLHKIGLDFNVLTF